MKTLSALMLALLPALAGLGCTAQPDDGDPTCTGEKCDDVNDQTAAEKSVCDSKFVDMSGRSTKVKAGQLNDPIAKAIFKAGTNCPLSYVDAMAKLRETDKTGCEMGGNAGLNTRLVSERSQTRGVADSYRGVVTRQCGSRPEHAMLFSLFGLSPTGDLPENFEAIGFDETKGVFNYYAIEDGAWNFHGDSSDLLKGPGEDGKRRCANCHPGGGLVMKELESPWMHWEGDTTTPGAQEFITKHAAELGGKRDGINMESIVRAGNDAAALKRLENLKKQGLKAVLKPLFCTVEINLHNGSGGTSPVNNDAGGSELSRIPADFLVDAQALGTFDSVPVMGADYRAQVVANGQKVATRGTALKDKDGKPALDTIFDFAFAKRSAVDNLYVQKLIQAGIIDDEFAKDVLIVDFTRPIFSSDRCGLLDLAPTLAEADMTAAKVKDGFLAKLASPAAGSPAAELKANLTAGDAAKNATTRLAVFFSACKARPGKDFLADAMKVNSLRRNKARELPVMEFDETLPSDSLSVDGNSRLDPKTCLLTTSFVGP